MPTDTTDITLALALTAAGAVVFAGLTTGLVQILKSLAGGLVSGHEQLLAFIISAVWVIVAMASGVQDGTLTLTIATVFAGFLAWYGIARIAMGIHDDVSRAPTAVGVAMAISLSLMLLLLLMAAPVAAVEAGKVFGLGKVF